MNKKLWKGHRLIGGDGSTLNLPITKDILEYFNVYSTTELGGRTSLARVFFLYDLLNDFIVHGELSNMKVGEKPLLMKSLPLVKDINDIYILDRGFGHFCTLAELINNKKLFCVRISKETNFAKLVLQQRSKDIVITWRPTTKEKANSRKNKISSDPMLLRVVKVKLKSGETELLATNLTNMEKYSHLDIRQLYRLRWGVEEGFKKFKPKMKIEQFGCRKAEGIFQEFYAHIFCFNMISLSGSIANLLIEEKTAHRKKKYKYNWQNAYRFFRDKVIRFCNLIKNIEMLFNQLINQIVSSVIAIKPDRSFIRDLRHKNKQRRLTQLLK
jgi:hypothetical protein